MGSRREIAIGQRAVALGWLHPEHARACYDRAVQQGSGLLQEALRAGLLSQDQARFLASSDAASSSAPATLPLGSDLRRASPPSSSEVTAAPKMGPGLPKVGSEIGGYKLLKLLGQGGMGAVFVAEKHGKRAALKLITIEDETALERFDREARAVAAVDRHPNIVGVHGYERDGPVPFLVLELIEGQGLDSVLSKEGPPPLEQALIWMIAVAKAVGFIHKRGLLHRDLKPANILIRERDQSPMVTDFGLVRGGRSDGLTRSTEVLGTPSYMAPEQASSENERIGPATDIWALGVILYELATGERPFVASGPMQLINKIIFKDPPPPREHNREVPRDLEAVILRALRKEPEERYRTAEAFAEDCRRVLNEEPLSEDPETFDRRAWRRARRKLGRRMLLGLVGVVLVTSLVGLSLPFLNLLKMSEEDFQNSVAKADGAIAAAASSPELGYGYLPALMIRAAPPFEDREPPPEPSEALAAIDRAFDDVARLREQASRDGREEVFARVIDAKRWRLYQRSVLLLRGLRGQGGGAARGDIGRFLDGFAGLEGEAAIERWRAIRDAELAGYSRLGVALVQLRARRWSEALATLGACRMTARPSLAEAARLLESQAMEEAAIAGLLLDDRRERNRRVEALTRLWSSLDDPNWSRWQGLVLERYASSLEIGRVVRALDDLGDQVPGYPKPDPSPALLMEAGVSAVEEGALGEAFRYYVRANEKDKENYPIPPKVSREVLVKELTRALLDRDFARTYALILGVSRAGVFLDARREADLVFLDLGLLDKAIQRAPLDPCAQYWRAAVRDLDKRIEEDPKLSSEQKAAALRRLFEDKALRFEKVIANPRTNKTFKALALAEHAAMVRRLTFKFGDTSREVREAVRVQLRAEFEECLGLGSHPKPHEVFESLMRLECGGRDESFFRDREAMERLIKICDRWERCLERWRVVGEENREFQEGLAVYFEDVDNRHQYRILLNRCLYLNWLGRHVEAEKAAAAALAMERGALAGVYEPYHKLEVTAPRELVLALAQQGRWSEAEAEARRALGEGRDSKLRKSVLDIWEGAGREAPADFRE